MNTFAGIGRNFRFMLVHVQKQLEHTRELLAEPAPRLVKSIRSGEGYIDTQKSLIENECFRFIRGPNTEDDGAIATVRAVSTITTNLERVADFTVNITRQLEHYSDPTCVRLIDGPAFIQKVLGGIEMIEPALFERDTDRALRICVLEDDIDRMYADQIRKLILQLRGGAQVEDHVTSLFIAQYLERMGDALLNIGEAILFAVLGERLKFHQYRVLDDALAGSGALRQPLASAELDSIWGTRSGVRIGSIRERTDGEAGRRVLFKEGNPEKLTRERTSLARWEQVAPGLVPIVVEYQTQGEGAALLLQYLDGRTLQEIAINNEPVLVRRVLNRLIETIEAVWTATRKDQPVQADYLRQLSERIEDVYRLHPEFRGGEVQMGGLRIPSFAERLSAAASIDAELPAPFSVFIHGDFNLDNILYDVDRDQLHFIDVQRSRDMDYVQDVSVLLVSAFRLPVMSVPARRSLETLSRGFLDFARRFAAQRGDATFEARLALGLIRSFASSTRFELNRDFAHSMHDRAALLLSRLLAHRGKPWSSFRVPSGVLVY